MSYHILHLLSHNLRVRLKLDQLHITDLDSGTDKSVPLADVAAIVCAARDTEFSASSLRRMAELNVLLLICNEKFEPIIAPPTLNCSAARSNGRPTGKRPCGGRSSPPKSATKLPISLT